MIKGSLVAAPRHLEIEYDQESHISSPLTPSFHREQATVPSTLKSLWDGGVRELHKDRHASNWDHEAT